MSAKAVGSDRYRRSMPEKKEKKKKISRRPRSVARELIPFEAL